MLENVHCHPLKAHRWLVMTVSLITLLHPLLCLSLLDPSLPLHKPLQPLLCVKLATSSQNRDWWRQHYRDRVRVVRVCADGSVLRRDLVYVQVVVVVVSVVLVVVDAGNYVCNHIEDGHDGPEENHLADPHNAALR